MTNYWFKMFKPQNSLLMVYSPDRRGLSYIFAHRRPQLEAQDVDQDGRKCCVWHGIPGKQEVHSSVRV